MENTFLVTPMSQNISLEPGEVYTGSITVANPANSTEDFSYVVSVSPYSVVGEDYSADLATMSDRTMLKDWIRISESTGVLKPNESKKVDFTIAVPKSAPAGGQYAVITVTENSSAKSGGGVAVDSIFEIGSLIYASVAGETVREGEILENIVPEFVTGLPVTLSSAFSNTGNVHQIANININIKNVLTGEEILSAKDRGSYNELIMPKTRRLIKYNMEDLPPVGIVEIKQSIIYGGNLSVEVKNVVICPIWFMALIAAVLIGGIWSIAHAIKKHRQKRLSL